MIRSHGLELPSSASIFSALERVVGNEEATAIWGPALVAAGIAETHGELDLTELRAIAGVLQDQGGFVGVLGLSTIVRLDSWQLLSERGVET